VMARSVNQYFRSPKCLLAVVAVRTMETRRACSGKALRVAHQLSYQQRGRHREDRKQQGREEDQPGADRYMRHRAYPRFLFAPIGSATSVAHRPAPGAVATSKLSGQATMPLQASFRSCAFNFMHAFLQPTNGVEPARTLK
jgi:hypothetical protein